MVFCDDEVGVLSDLYYINLLSEYGDWFDLNYEELRRKYPNKFIAIKDKKVIAVSSDLNSLIDELKALNIDLNKVLIEFIPEEDLEFIL